VCSLGGILVERIARIVPARRLALAGFAGCAYSRARIPRPPAGERVRVIFTHIPSGATVPVHTHRWSSVAYLLSWSDFIRRDHHGNVLLDSRQSRAAPPQIPAVQWLQPLPPHTVENVGPSEIRIFIVELKDM
jgi:hypothetical protein